MSLDLNEGRYDRQELITWWQQDVLKQSRVLVVGAGALGNEVIKNLALLGVGEIVVIDLDFIATSNLARCVFFREGDEGGFKAEIVAARSSDLNPGTQVEYIVGNVTHQGVGWVGQFNLVIGFLDNREARLWVNQAARKMGVTWIDGAIEGIRGIVKVFPPTGACYECTLGEKDREILNLRRACSLLTADEVELGKTPTTATSSSVVAGFQVQEAIRLLHGQPSPIANAGWTFLGETFDTYIVSYTEDEWCQAHEIYQDLRDATYLPEDSLADVFRKAGIVFSADASVSFEREILRVAKCLICAWELTVNRAISDVAVGEASCPNCLKVGQLDIAITVGMDDSLLGVSLESLRIPNDDVVTVFDNGTSAHYLLRRADA